LKFTCMTAMMVVSALAVSLQSSAQDRPDFSQRARYSIVTFGTLGGPNLPSSSGHTCLGFVWRDGMTSGLPTLGGHNGFAAGDNNQGQIAGWAESAMTTRSHCRSPRSDCQFSLDIS